MKWFCSALALFGIGTAYAGDPTRPPEAYISTKPTTEPAQSVSRLQFIKYNKAGTAKQERGSAAMIDGELYKQGDMIGDAQLVRINVDSVILSGPAGQEELKLNPEIDIQFHKPRGARK